MLMWIAVFVIALITFWHARLRTRSPYDRRPRYQSLTAVTQDIREVDYVVVGAGPGGLAACQRLLIELAAAETAAVRSRTVLLVEPGQDTLAATAVQELWQVTVAKQRLLCFAPECVATALSIAPPTLFEPRGIDEGCVTRRPFRPSPAEDLQEANATPTNAEEAETRRQRTDRDRQLLYTTYPRGRGVGGGSLLDWGLVVESDPHARTPCEPVLPALGEQPLAAQTSPLSWTFRDAATALRATADGVGTAAMGAAVAEAPLWSLGSVFRPRVRVDASGRRLPLSAALLAAVPPASLPQLSVLTGFTVARLGLDDAVDADTTETTVREVLVRPNGASSASVPIRVRHGVVLAAGAVHSPRVLYESLLHSPLAVHRERCARCVVPRGLTCPVTKVRDCLALPFITKVHMRVSTDRVNLCDAKNSIMYAFAQRGAYLAPFSDSVASFPLPALGPRAEMLIVLLPLGGRDTALYHRLGWDRILGSFPEAMTMLLVLNGVAELGFDLPLAAGTAPLVAPLRRCVSVDAPVVLPEALQSGVTEAFRKGMHLCRELVTTAPLDYLTPGTEAVDVTLLKSDARKAFRFAQLTHTLAKHLTMAKKRELAELSTWALEAGKSAEYENAYIQQHAYWLGFASGSSAPFLRDTHRVDGVRNLHVGDASGAASEEVSSLFAGSVTCAMNAGCRAAQAVMGA